MKKNKLEKDKPFRFGNFYVTLIDQTLSVDGIAHESTLEERAYTEEEREKKGIVFINALKISSLEGLWQVLLSESSSMYALIVYLIENNSKENNEVLSTLFTNMSFVTTIGFGMFQSSVLRVAETILIESDNVSSKEKKIEQCHQLCVELETFFKNCLQFYNPKEKQDLSDEEMKHAELADELKKMVN